MWTYPRNELQVTVMRVLTWFALILLLLSITACSGKSVVMKQELAAPPVLCLEQIEGEAGKVADRDLPALPEHGDCTGPPETFNACMEEKARDELATENRAEEAFDLERERRWACVRYVREVRDQ